MKNKIKNFLKESLIKAHQHTEAVRESVDTLATMLHNWLDELQEKIEGDEVDYNSLWKDKVDSHLDILSACPPPHLKHATKEEIHDFANVIRDNNEFVQKKGDA